MRKLLGSLLAVGGLATLAACGDDVSITETPEVVTISGAPTTAIKVGDVVQLSANVAVTWSSAAPAVATVDAASGLVTAVGAGIVSVTATSQEDATKKASVTITVTGNISPTVSIFAVTAGGTTTPVNPNNVFGQIDVVVNMDPGDFTVASLDLLVDGQVAQTQTFAAALTEPKPVDEMAAQVQQVSFSLNTAEFDPNTGAVTWTNGTHTISARVTVTGGGSGGAAEPSRTLTFNNASGFVARVTNTNTVGGPASAINPSTGLKWVQGDVELELAAVNYAAGGTTVTSVNGSFLGRAFSATPAAGTQIFTIDFLNSGSATTNIVNYQTAADADKLPAVTASVLSSGSQGPTNVLNVGAQAANAGLTPLDSTRVDNVAPAAPAVGAFPIWLNASFTFDTTAAAVSGVTDAGVDNVSVEFWYIAGANPASACSLTGMTQITDASALAETIVNTAYNGKVVVKDALGNRRCAPLGNSWGADFTAPANVTFSGVADNAVFNATGTADGTNYVLASSGDNASGISATTPGLVSILRVPSTGNDDCELGSGSSCAAVAAPATGSITNSAAQEGYYTLTAQMTDVAGNAAPVPAFSRLFLVDQSAPTFTGNVGLAAQYQGNAAATFTNITANDNLDLARLFGVVSYTAAGLNIEYPAQSIGTFGTPLEKTFSGDYTIPSLIRCINPAGSGFAANAANEAQQITFIAEDFAANQGAVSPVPGALVAALDNCGAVGNQTAPSVINSWLDGTPSYGTGKTQVSKGGTTTGANSATVQLSAVADVSLDNSPQPFTRVEFYYQNAAGNWVLIGQATIPTSPVQTVTTRTWTYTLTWDPDASVPTNAATNVIAIAVDAQGDAAATAGAVVNVAN